MKKTLLFAAAMLTIALVFVYSTGQSEEPAAPGQSRIVAMLQVIIGPETGQGQFIEEYERITGVELEIVQPAHNQYYEKVQLAFASGDMPDTLEIGDSYVQKYARDGAIVDITEFVESSAIISRIEPEFIEATRFPNGKLYSLPYDSGGGTITYVRKDWLDKLGLDVPETWEEFYDMLVAFRDNDPDGNGKDDTIPYVAPGVTEDIYCRDIYQDAVADFTIKNGKWVDGYAEPEFTDAMNRLVRLYDEGLIDPEIFTNQTSTCREKLYAGNVGVWNYWIGNWNVALDNGVQSGPAGPNASMLPIPAIEGSHYVNRVPPQIAITVGAESPEFVFKNFMELMHDRGAGQMLFTHGVEGVHYEVVEGTYRPLPRLDNPDSLFAKTFAHPEWPINDWKDPFDLEPRVVNSVAVHRDSMLQNSMLPPSETYLKVSGDLSALRKEIVSKIAIGDLSPEEGLAQYKREAEALGMSKILNEMNSMM